MAESVKETSNQTNKAGLYRHPESGAELVAKNHPKFGSAKADAYVRVGYVYVADEGEKKEQPKAQKSEKGSK